MLMNVRGRVRDQGKNRDPQEQEQEASLFQGVEQSPKTPGQWLMGIREGLGDMDPREPSWGSE